MLFSLSGCSKSCYELSSLKHYTVNFNDLPEDVIMYLKNPSEYETDFQNMLVELPKNKKVNYSLETVNTLIGTWVLYEKLIDKEKNIYYKIKQGVPDPYIVFEDKLYIPDRFNILTTVDDFSKVEFTCYILK
jgi:hypothetical protein